MNRLVFQFLIFLSLSMIVFAKSFDEQLAFGICCGVSNPSCCAPGAESGGFPKSLFDD
uniref:Candidate secreted effector n=2 Tax=Meloidogyne TaxID=189290 RepID=A0A914KKC7_MELIC|nr:unnamed protein product [Meloidogyne enterolobii]